MLPAYCADQARCYTTLMNNHGENRFCEIASGPNADDYQWTGAS